MNFSAVILAGGASQRMGRDKAWIHLEAKPLLLQQLELVRSLGAQEVFVSGRSDTDYSAVNCPVLLDHKPGAGPLAGIERSLAETRASLVLVLAVDLPFMEPGLLSDLLNQCTPTTGVVPSNQGRLEPLAAIYPKSAHALAAQRLELSQNSASGFALACAEAGLVRLFSVSASLAHCFRNWNCPEDLLPQ